MNKYYLILELTTVCNFNCIYCYNVWKENGQFERKDLSVGEVEVIISNSSKNAFLAGVTLAGGEPLLNENIFEIATFLKSRKIRTSITTNGILLSEENVIKLIQCGVSHFEVSMPSGDTEIFYKLCGSEELKKVRAAILNIKKYGAKCSVAAVITKINYHETADIIELSAAIGADHFMFNRFVSGGRGKEFSLSLKPDSTELLNALNEANKASATFNIPVIVSIPVEHCRYDTSEFNNLLFGTCSCGKHKWVADPYGNLRSCEQNPKILGDLLTEDFQNMILKSDLHEFNTNNLTANCEDMSCFTACGGGCRFNREL